MLPVFAIIWALGIIHSTAAKPNLTVLMVLNDPYLMHKDYDGQVEGEYEGFSVDLLKVLEKELGVAMTIQVKDTYGVYEESSEKWNGVVGELADGSADMAIADLTVTEARDEAIDFSIPFMSGGITILTKKPRKNEKYLSFLDAFTLDVWIIIVVSYMVLGVAYIVINNIKKKNEKWEDSKISVFSLPILKITTIVFTILIACMYTASLSAFLSVEPIEEPIESVEDLARQNFVKFGAVHGGSTMDFFKATEISFYQTWRFLDDNNLNMRNNKEGVERVLKEDGNYAFLMESTSANYVTERMCDLETVGALINEFHYAIGLPLNSQYRKPVNQAILKLKSDGTLKKLEQKWWKQKRGGGACASADRGTRRILHLALTSLSGVFWMLLAGFIVSVLAILLEIFLLKLE